MTRDEAEGCIGRSGRYGSKGRCQAPVVFDVAGDGSCGRHLAWVVRRRLQETGREAVRVALDNGALGE